MLCFLNDKVTLFVILLFYILLQCRAEDNPDLPKWTAPGYDFRSFRKIFFDKTDNKIYAGGVNIIYKFDPENITTPPKVLEWAPEPMNTETCLMFKKSDPMLCQNNIGVLTSFNRTHLYACGTMAYNPSCSFIVKETMSLVQVESSIASVQWRSPYDPYVSTISVVSNETLFTATEVGMQGQDGIISKSFNGYPLRTEEEDKYWLNNPVFVGGLLGRNPDPSHEKVFLFFREKSEEFQPYKYGMSSDPNTRNVVSRVASVCVNDHGGSAWVLNRKFATYTKMSIVCNTESTGTDPPFRYQHLESTFVVENPEDPADPTIYGLFTMPGNAVAGSAVCSYKMSDIKRAMTTNQYWRRNTDNGPKTTYKGKGNGPGQCSDDTQTLAQSRLQFGENHPIKFGDIFPSKEHPSYQESGIRYWRVVVGEINSNRSSFGANATVMYMITMKGLLKRVVHASAISARPWSLPDIQVVKLEENEIVVDMLLGDRFLYIATNSSLTQMPLDFCSYYSRNNDECSECKHARDPFCSLSTSGSCVSVYGLSQGELRASAKPDVVCPPSQVKKTSESILIGELRANLTNLQSENEEVKRDITVLMSLQRQNQAELNSCNDRLDFSNASVSHLSALLENATSRNEEVKKEQNISEELLINCTKTKMRLLKSNVRLALELRDRPTQADVDKQMYRVETARNGAQLALENCRTEHDVVSTDQRTCRQNLKQLEDKLEVFNETCAREKRSVADTLSLEIEIMHNKLIATHKQKENQKRTYHQIMGMLNGKLKKCYDATDELNNKLRLMLKTSKSYAVKMSTMHHRHRRETRLIKQLRWLHRTNGYRGQQSCDHNGWFLSKSSGHLFLLGNRRGSFQKAAETCELLGGKLAVFNDQAEVKYITTIIRAFEPTRHYWIGLVKHSNGSLIWNDGTHLDGLGSRFHKKQSFRLRKRAPYCIEATAGDKWNLIPCSRLRRPICQKVLPPGIRNNPQVIETFRKLVS